MLIPYLSGHPFLHWPHLVCNTVDYCQCQSPIYQDTHFYDNMPKSPKIILDIVCQSPIYQDTHFYQLMENSSTFTEPIVSIPYLSGHPFLPGQRGNPVYCACRAVSIPYLSGHPFLRYRRYTYKDIMKCVNPLSIRTPIST